jgi:hypothetical protein
MQNAEGENHAITTQPPPKQLAYYLVTSSLQVLILAGVSVYQPKTGCRADRAKASPDFGLRVSDFPRPALAR